MSPFAADQVRAGGVLRRILCTAVVNPALSGAIDFVNTLRRAQGDLKVLAVLDEKDQQASQIPGADGTSARRMR
jgi:hypothetical protein